MFKPKQKTLKQSLVAAVLKAVMITVAFGGSFAAVSAMNAGNMTMVAPEHNGGSEMQKPLAQGSPGDLIQKHDCWTGAAPKDMEGKMPGHVVVTIDGRVAPTYGGSRLVGQALSQIFEGENHNLEVHGFCR